MQIHLLKDKDGKFLQIFILISIFPVFLIRTKLFTWHPLPTFLPEHKQMLDLPFTLQELQDAIKYLKCYKAPGPDGYKGEFYKQFSAGMSASQVL